MDIRSHNIFRLHSQIGHITLLKGGRARRRDEVRSKLGKSLKRTDFISRKSARSFFAAPANEIGNFPLENLIYLFVQTVFLTVLLFKTGKTKGSLVASHNLNLPTCGRAGRTRLGANRN